jgi:hypothetical protein
MKLENVLGGFVLGAMGGAAGIGAMSLYWKVVKGMAGHDPRQLTTAHTHALNDISAVGTQHEEEEGSTAAVGRKAYESVTGGEPPEEAKGALSTGVHWIYGTFMGGLYGAMRRRRRDPDVAGGLIFGTALWVLGDEFMVPFLGLSEGPTAFPLEQHVHRFGAHLAYGIAVAAVTQVLYNLSPDVKLRVLRV